MIDERRVGPLLDPVDGLPIEAGGFAESFLCQLLAFSFGSDGVPNGSTALLDPVGQGIGWHPLTLVGHVINVCTMLGTFVSTR